MLTRPPPILKRAPGQYAIHAATTPVKDLPPLPIFNKSVKIGATVHIHQAPLPIVPMKPPSSGNPESGPWEWQLTQTEGRTRFPSNPGNPFDDNWRSNDPSAGEVHPGNFDPMEFATIWTSMPFTMYQSDAATLYEQNFRGAKYRLHPNNINIFDQVISRGTVVVVGGLEHPDIKYIATWTRSINERTSLVQLNAFAEDQRFTKYDNEDWPTLLLLVPNQFNQVPLPSHLHAYYEDLIKEAEIGCLSGNAVWRSLSSNIHSLFPSRHISMSHN